MSTNENEHMCLNCLDLKNELKDKENNDICSDCLKITKHRKENLIIIDNIKLNLNKDLGPSVVIRIPPGVLEANVAKVLNVANNGLSYSK